MMRILYACTSHIGKRRGNNEDNFWCNGDFLPEQNPGTEGIISGTAEAESLPGFAVFDGMGGESCGEVASYLAASRFDQCWNSGKESFREKPEETLKELCLKLNEAVCDYQKEHNILSMGSTANVSGWIGEDVYVANLGDSRTYLLHDGALTRLSTDHVLGGSMFLKAPLTQYLGFDEEDMVLEPSLVHVTCSFGDRILICSDGVTDMIAEEEIGRLLLKEKNVADAVSVLLSTALENGGRDNITMILCELSDREDTDKADAIQESADAAPGNAHETEAGADAVTGNVHVTEAGADAASGQADVAKAGADAASGNEPSSLWGRFVRWIRGKD